MSPALRRVGRTLLVVLSFVFLAVVLVRQRDQLLAYEWHVVPGRLALSVAAYAAILVASVWIWSETIRRFGVRPPFPVLARIWFLSNLSRYIPGKIWQFIGVAELSRVVGIRPMTAVTSLLLNMGFVLIAAVLVGAWLMPPFGEAVAGLRLGLRVASPFLLLLLHPRCIRLMTGWTERITRRPLAPWSGRWRDGFWICALCGLEWLAMGAAFTIFVGSLTPIGAEAFPALAAAYALSFAAGYAVFLPAGLGAKEGVLAALLATVLPLSVAAAVAVAARVWTILAELVPVLIFLRPIGRRAVGDEASTVHPIDGTTC